MPVNRKLLFILEKIFKQQKKWKCEEKNIKINKQPQTRTTKIFKKKKKLI